MAKKAKTEAELLKEKLFYELFSITQKATKNSSILQKQKENLLILR